MPIRDSLFGRERFVKTTNIITTKKLYKYNYYSILVLSLCLLGSWNIILIVSAIKKVAQNGVSIRCNNNYRPKCDFKTKPFIFVSQNLNILASYQHKSNRAASHNLLRYKNK